MGAEHSAQSKHFHFEEVEHDFNETASADSSNSSNGRSPNSRTSSSNNNWGWFHDTSSNGRGQNSSSARSDDGGGTAFLHEPLMRTMSLPAPITEPPLYVLESPLSSQRLWYSTAGQRPQQPEHERKAMEALWEKNIAQSEVMPSNYRPLSPHQIDIPELDGGRTGATGEIILRGKAPFSNAVSKSFFKGSESFVGGMNLKRGNNKSSQEQQQQQQQAFMLPSPLALVSLSSCWSSVTLQLPRFRVVQRWRPIALQSLSLLPSNITDCAVQHRSETLAEFLVVVSLRGPKHDGLMTFGVWRRHSHFEQLAAKVSAEAFASTFANSRLSWQCLLSRKRWFRCLDKEYLSLKCFLLERFLQDVLYESGNAGLISAFLELVNEGAR